MKGSSVTGVRAGAEISMSWQMYRSGRYGMRRRVLPAKYADWVSLAREVLCGTSSVVAVDDPANQAALQPIIVYIIGRSLPISLCDRLDRRLTCRKGTFRSPLCATHRFNGFARDLGKDRAVQPAVV
jgi:hypothetical protein